MCFEDIDVTVHTIEGRTGAPCFASCARFAMTKLGVPALYPNGSLVILLASEDYMAQLNAKHKSSNMPTDVLSFPVGKELWQVLPGTWGEIVLCLPVIARNKSKPFLEQASFILIHGLLHLLGYTHDLQYEYEAMNRLEIALTSMWLDVNNKIENRRVIT